MSFEPQNEATRRILESAVRLLGEYNRDLVNTIYALGVVDGQVRALGCPLELVTRNGEKCAGEPQS